MKRFRGESVEFYTKTADNQKLSVPDQIDAFCQENDLDVELFNKIREDFPDEEYLPIEKPKFENVTKEFIDGYKAIHGKGSSRKKEKYCEKYGISEYRISQGYYKIID